MRERDDDEWIAAAAAYVEAKRAADAAAKALDEAKAQLVGLASHTSESGGGVSVTRYWKSGTIDYKKIPELRYVGPGAIPRCRSEQEVRALRRVRSEGGRAAAIARRPFRPAIRR